MVPLINYRVIFVLNLSQGFFLTSGFARYEYLGKMQKTSAITTQTGFILGKYSQDCAATSRVILFYTKQINTTFTQS